MSHFQKSNIESDIYSAQQAVKNSISTNNIDMKFARSFDTVFNGFSGEVMYEKIELIERIKGVKKVYISNSMKDQLIIEPNMSSSNEMIGSGYVWGTSEYSVNSTQGLDGKYYTEKVPNGYNYCDLNDTILDFGPDASEHGMHVAGTVRSNGEIKGVASESQVLAMKVFSNDPVYATTFDDIYLVAIEDSVKLKADVLNMILGSTASFYIAESAVDVAITNATENRIVCSISAGNSRYTQYGWTRNYGLPFKVDPDYGVVDTSRNYRSPN